MRRTPQVARRIALASTLLTLASVPWLTEPPLGPARRAPRIAAIAVRDDVSAFQELGTALFTRPALERSYGEVVYLTLGPERASWEDASRALERLGGEYERVDIFLLTHGNFVTRLFAATEAARAGKIGLVYHTGCGNAYEASRWLALGARTFIGHRGPRSMSPVYYVAFLRRWLRGGTAQETHDGAARIMDAVIRPLDPEVADESAAGLFGDEALRLEATR
jgi:hypothetical protein